MQRLGGVITSVLDKISIWLTVIGAAALFLMMIAMAVDAVARKVVGTVPGAYEMSIGLMVAVMFLPQAYTQMRKGNVSVDILTSRLSPKTQAVLGGFGAVLGMGVLALLSWVSWQKAWESTLVREIIPGMRYYPMWPFRWLVVLGAGVLTLQFLRTAVVQFLDAGRKRS